MGTSNGLKHIVGAAAVAVSTALPAADHPGIAWEAHDRAGWPAPLLASARAYTAERKTAAVIIVQDGKVVDQWGAVERKYEVRSIRKSLLNALYGVHVGDGSVDLGKTLEEIGIDDTPPSLTPSEKQATILDLLRARSGIYHAAARETPQMRAGRPPRGSHPPGTFFYYNNWDFNVLGAIFEKTTGRNIFADFDERIARPIGMQDYVPADGRFAAAEGSTVAGDSRYLNYVFSLSARDMARFGLLYLRNGRWGDRQVLPASWVTRSTTSYSEFETPRTMGSVGYGLLWWRTEWGYAALGNGGHVIAVIPAKDMVVVHRVAYDPPREDVVPYPEVDRLVRMLIAGAPDPRNRQ